ncbi:hypothetical protein Glove_141g104 [Diversispora epigaea]|uniref:Uncharacterized protein n=1 Tax=Diversispora epigaea TaxID=1348612 RepID=A0A397IZ82_9GLOM|nr:hypothetical protein Glove_141g104 [Diversispora epigaea]
MANVRTLRDINSKGYRLGSTREVELEEALRDSCITNSELIEDFKNYRKVYSEFSKNIKQDKTQLQRDIKQSNEDKEKLSKHASQLIDEVKRLKVNNTNLTSQITQSQISRDEYKARYDIQLKEIKSLQAMIKIFEEFSKNIKQDKTQLQRDIKQSNEDKEKLSKHASQLIDEVKRLKVNNTNLTSQITQSQISRDEYKARYDIQLKEIKSLQAMIKIFEGKLTSAQKDAFSIQENLSKTESENLSLKSKMDEFKQIEVELEQVRGKLVSAQEDLLKKESEILSFKSKITEVEQELVSTVSELENLKSEDISVELTRPKPTVSSTQKKYRKYRKNYK